MTKQFTVVFYSDNAGGWAKVKRAVLQNLRIADKISEYSYQNGDYAFLEEDSDFPKLVYALQQHNTRVKCVRKHTDKESRIRSYSRYQHV